MWKNMIYFRLCLRKNMTCYGLDHTPWPEKNNCTESRWLMLHWCASILLWRICDTHTYTAFYKLPYLFNASQHKNHVTECLRKLPVRLYTPSHSIPDVPESIQNSFVEEYNRHTKAENNHRCLMELENVYHKPKQLTHRFITTPTNFTSDF